jgi:PAS domain S-box-containing protein
MDAILILDDESTSLRLMTDILVAEGYLVRPADSAHLALASVSAQPPDLILADVHMPGMDGFEFCRRLKPLQGPSTIPLIFLSASTDAKARVEGLKLGAVDFISKPFRREELLARVRTHLELAQLRGQLKRQVDQRTAELRSVIARLEREVAERTKAEEALRESEARFRNMANTAPVLIWVAGPDKLCTFFNRTWLDFTGRTMEQELGYGWIESVHPDDQHSCVSTYLSAFEARRDFRAEYRLRRRDGEYRWVLHEGVPRAQPDEKFLGYVGCCIDVTDVRRAQEESLGRKRIESLRLLAGGIAHDFTNLMGGILATTEFAEEQIAEGSSASEEIRNIKAVARQAVQMARELMMYAGKDNGSFELLDLSREVEEISEILKSSAPKNFPVLRSDLAKNLPPIHANPTQIRQIVMNLVINAAEAVGDAEGVIQIRTRLLSRDEKPGPDETGRRVDGEYLKLEVSDTGCGMEHEQQARMFDPLFTTKGKGHGLGLAVVQAIVHAHGGDICVTSTPGVGTTFEIFLPCVAVRAKVATANTCSS